MKKFLAYLKGWRGITLTAYVWLILMGWVIVYVDIISAEVKRRFYAVSVAEFVLIAAVYFCPKLLHWAECINISPDEEPANERKFFLKTWLAVFAVFFVLYLIFFPGGFNEDAIEQYGQALNGKYNDWHPVIGTLLIYTLPLKLTGNWQGAPVLFQTVIFSLALAYMSYTVLLYGQNRKYARNFLIYIMLNPAVLFIWMVTLKDSIFSIALLVLMTFAVHIHFTKGDWLKSKTHLLMFIIVLALGTLFRHNAVLFTLPLLVAVSMYISKKKAALIFILSAVLIWTIRYPLYTSMNVVPPGKRQIETLGVPMSMIACAVKESPQKLDQDILDFAYRIAPEDVWQEKYEPIGGFIAVRYAAAAKSRTEEERQRLLKVINLNVIEETGWKKVLEMSLRCLREAPLASLRGFCGLTSIVFGIAGPPLGTITPSILENNLGLRNNNLFDLSFIYRPIKNLVLSARDPSRIKTYKTTNEFNLTDSESGEFSLQSLIRLCIYGVMVLLRHLFWCIGMLNLAVIIFALAKLKFNKLYDWKRLFIVLPMLTYNYGTMLLISANIFRVFCYSYLIMPLVLLVLIKPSEEANL